MVEFNRDIFFSEYSTARGRQLEMHDQFANKGYLTLYDVYDICRIGPKKPEYKNWGWDNAQGLPEVLYNNTDDTSKICISYDPIFKENWEPEPEPEVVEEKPDMVNHPPHYQRNGIEVIDIIKACTADLKGIEATDTGNVIKYICRWPHKNGIEDLKKARWYIDHLINEVENKEKETE